MATEMSSETYVSICHFLAYELLDFHRWPAVTQVFVRQLTQRGRCPSVWRPMNRSDNDHRWAIFSSKFAINWLLEKPSSYIKCVVTLVCEILISENWRALRWMLEHAIYMVSQKSSPPYDFRRYFRLGWVYLHKIVYIYWQFIYPHTSIDFRLFILTFNEMALSLLRAPIILRF